MPNSQTEGDFRLGPWVNTQKMHGRAGRLSRDRIARLEALPGWVWDVVGAAWEQALGLLQSYVGREGHARVPNQHTEDGFRLGSWVSEQRRAKKAGVCHQIGLPALKLCPVGFGSCGRGNRLTGQALGRTPEEEER